MTSYFPFRKRELFHRLFDADPTSLASNVLRLPDQGANPVRRPIRRLATPDSSFPERYRPVLLDENGHPLAIGIAREARTAQLSTMKRYLVSEEALPPHTILEVPMGKAGPSAEGEPKSHRGEEGTRENIIVPVFYATDREPMKSSGPNLNYSGNRSQHGQTHLGMCSVSIPNIHKIGYLERAPLVEDLGEASAGQTRHLAQHHSNGCWQVLE